MSEPTYHITDHAREEAERRGIPFAVLQTVMESPSQIVDAHSDRKAYQSKVEIDGKLYVVRAIVELTNPLTVWLLSTARARLRSIGAMNHESDL